VQTAPAFALEPDIVGDGPPIVIIGNGPVGMRCAAELLERLPGTPVVIYGEETDEPYDRVRLSALLVGEVPWDALRHRLPEDVEARLDQRLGCRVIRIDPAGRLIEDAAGRHQGYRALVLATGSSPHVPQLPGIDLDGVYTFRSLADTNRLIARRARSRHTVVLGGGLLGLEAARGMQRSATRVIVVEHADRLMSRQLDEPAAETLAAQVSRLGIELVVGQGVRRVVGVNRVEGVELLSGEVIACDTLVVAAGIRPNLELARQAGIAFGRGIRVDDAMRTSAPDVYAVGECAEHRGEVYGLVAPGLEQAAVAAAHLAGSEGRYRGSINVTRLKVAGTQVFSLGPMGADASSGYGERYLFSDPKDGIYRAVLVRRHRLAGVIGVGTWTETLRLQNAVTQRQLVWPWQMWRFQRTGLLWPDDEASDVRQWPATTVVCQCRGVSRGALGQAVQQGACSVAELGEATGAGTVCGSCKPLLHRLVSPAAPREPVRWQPLLTAIAFLTLLSGLAFLAAPPVPYPDTVQVDLRWDALWRDGLLKQITGFTVLGLSIVALAMSPRKRVARLQRLGGFDAWRLLHLGAATLALAALALHTGLRLGSGLNAALMLSFAAMLLLGGLGTATLAFEHRLPAGAATRWRRRSVWWHILLFWPVPALLAAHVFKGYWY